jgi:hypothetical protein
LPPKPNAISWPRFLLALFMAMLSAGFLFVFWLYVFNTFFGFARTTSPEGSQLLATLAMQLAPAVLVLVSTFLPVFLAFALAPALIASLIVRWLGLRGAPGLAAVGAITGLAGLVLFQFVDVAFLGAHTPILSLQDSGVPALLSGASGGLAAWCIAFGWRPAGTR